MSSQEFSPRAGFSFPANGQGVQARVAAQVSRPRYWLHLLLLFLTLLTTSAWGAIMVDNFHHNRPPVQIGSDFEAFIRIWTDPAGLLLGLPFSLTLMTLLLAHEFGHYVACRYYSVDASLPYFLPAPTVIGTFGAFIRIRSPIYSKRVLFDVGIAGPLAGFVFLLPALAIGLAYSKVIPGVERGGDIIFGVPPLTSLIAAAIFPGVNPQDIYLHPVARAAWAGIFSTALNLLPIGQLDGGHILYAFLGRWHKLISRVLSVVLIPLGLFTGFHAWILWAVVMLWFGLRHPPIFDASSLGRGRRNLGIVALVVFLLCFMATPVSTP